MADKKEKRIEDYKQERTMELGLSQELPLSDDRSLYSNLMILYDLIPKYAGYICKRIHGRFLDNLERRFTFNGDEYKMVLQPARIKTKEGEMDFFPGKREELVEDALRKLAMDSSNNCMLFDGTIGMKFTLTQLQRELKNRGSNASLEKIKHALKVCSRSILEISLTNGKRNEFTITSPLFKTLIVINRTQYEDGEKYCFAQFHPLITIAVAKKAFRLYFYKTGMDLKTVLSSYLFKRMSYNFTQAALGEPFGINLTTLVKDAGLDFNIPLWRNFDKVKRSIKELVQKEVIQEVIYRPKKEGRKLVDVSITIYATDFFAAKVMKSNWVSKELGTDPKNKGRIHSEELNA